MGYPMTYPRVVTRNQLTGDYSGTGVWAGKDPPAAEKRDADARKLIAGDMRRLEKDQRDEAHLRRYATLAGITDHQAYIVLTAFFTDFAATESWKREPEWLAKPCWPDKRS